MSIASTDPLRDDREDTVPARIKRTMINAMFEKIPSARLTLHSTKLCTKFKIFRKKIFFGTKVTSEAFLSSSQNLKFTRLQGCTKTKR
jgi:hypothetical protein